MSSIARRGTEHDVVKGIGMLNFLWVDERNDVCPMDVRIYEPKEDGKTKNDHFRELLRLAKEWEVKPEAVVADSWYSSLDNLKCIRDYGWNFVMGLRKKQSGKQESEIVRPAYSRRRITDAFTGLWVHNGISVCVKKQTH